MPFEVPNHTQTPNSFLDESLRQITSLCELKVVLAIIRKTFGWQKRKERISLTQLEALTGLTRQGVQKGIKLALEHKYIEREEIGQGFFYQLALGNGSYQSNLLPSQNHCLELGNKTTLELGNRSSYIKEKKEKKEKDPVVPFSSLAFVEALNDFLAHHREIGKPYKPTGLRALYAKLESWGEVGATQALRESVSNRWQGVFKPKGNGHGQPSHPNAWVPGKVYT